MTAAITTEWDVPGFDLAPMAPATGPFAGRPFLETWWHHRARDEDELLLVSSDAALLPLLRRGDLVAFVGEQDLTDYHSPRGHDLDAAVRRLADTVGPGRRFDLNSVPEPAASRLGTALERAGVRCTVAVHHATAVVPLPPTHDRYLEQLGKKQRHEVRRKVRRFTSELGVPSLTRRTGDRAVAEFAAMHRLSGGDKGTFMTPAMEGFFAGLHRDAGAVVDVLAGADGRPVAAGFGFEDESGYYLYNSAFDPAAAEASPGVVLVGLLIEQAIDHGRSVFDFLKGDEGYKVRLGAVPRLLYRVSGRFGAGR